MEDKSAKHARSTGDKGAQAPALKIKRPSRKPLSAVTRSPEDLLRSKIGLLFLERHDLRAHPSDIRWAAFNKDRVQVSLLGCELRGLWGQELDPKLRREAAMKLREQTFLKLRQLSAELNEVTGKATGIYRCLAIEVRELVKAGVYRSTITRELIDSGRTASRASELLSVAGLPDAEFEHFALGDMTWNLALVSSRLTLEQVASFGAATGADLSQRDRDGAFPALVAGDGVNGGSEPILPGVDPSLVSPPSPATSPRSKQLPMRLNAKESQLQTMAKLRVELAKVAKFSRKGGVEDKYVEEIGGYRITIQPLKK